MSGILGSESDNDDSTQSSTISSINGSTRQQQQQQLQQQLQQQQQPYESSSSITARNPTTGNLVQSRLEHYSRRLSMLGLASSQDVIASDDNAREEPTNVIESEGNYESKQELPASASLQLNRLPQITNRAIERIGTQENESTKSQEKIQIRFQPIGSIAQINPSICKITATQPFSLVIQFLKKRIKVNEVFCYINNSFAPNPQLIVGDLWSQFKVGDELIVSYCGTTAFG